MDEYQEVIWNTLDDYHKRLWAPTVGMPGPWNDYISVNLRKDIYGIGKAFQLMEEEKDLNRLEAIIKKAHKIEDPEQRKQALEKTITRRVRRVAKSLYLEEKETLEYLDNIAGRRCIGRYNDGQEVQALKRKWKEI